MIFTLAYAIVAGSSVPLRPHTSPEASRAERDMIAWAARLGRARIKPEDLEPLNESGLSLDTSHQPSVLVTQQQMRDLQRGSDNPWTQKATYSIRVNVDFDADGHPDVAQMVTNSRQSAVIISFGGPRPRPPMVAYRGDFVFGPGEEIVAAGRNRVMLNISELGFVLMLLHEGEPRIYRTGE